MKTLHGLAMSPDFKIIGNGYNNKRKRKFIAGLFIKEMTPVLNIQEISVPLKLLT